jgi:hypothetical protein
MGNSGKVIHVDDLQNIQLETVFSLLALYTVVIAFYIIRDMVTMLPGAVQFFSMPGLNTKVATPVMSNCYLILLAGYTGYKEFVRYQNLQASPDAEVIVPKDQLLRYRRREVIVVFWVLLLMLAQVLNAEGLTPRLPMELSPIAMKAMGIWLAGLCTKGVLTRGRKKTVVAGRSRDELAQIIIGYLKVHATIDNAGCQAVTGLKRYPAIRLLKKLEKQGILEECSEKGVKLLYRLKSKQTQDPVEPAA